MAALQRAEALDQEQDQAVEQWRLQVECPRPSLSTSGETLTIEESMTLRSRTENAGL